MGKTVSAHTDSTTLDAMCRRLDYVNILRKRKMLLGHFQAKCSYELSRLLDYFGYAGAIRLDYFNLLKCYLRIVFRLDGKMMDEVFDAVLETFKKKAKGQIKYDPRVLEGMKEMVGKLFEMREAIEEEFKQVQYLKRLEESGVKVNWESFTPIVLEFNEPKKEESEK